MNTKTCRFCKKEIDELAKKCPYCIGYQKWYYNSQIYTWMISWIIVLTLLFLSFNKNSNNKTDFQEFVNDIDIKIEKVQVLKNGDSRYKVLNLVIDNKTKYNWQNAIFEVTYLDQDGKKNYTEIVHGFDIYLYKNKKTNCSIQLRPPNEFLNNKIKVKLSRISHDRF